MKILFFALLLFVGGVAQAGIDSIRIIPANPTATDTILVLTRCGVSELGDWNKYTNTTLDGTHVYRTICMEEVEEGILPMGWFFTDTVKLPPFGSTGYYWFHITYKETDTSFGCDAAYSVRKDSVLIGTDPTVSISDFSSIVHDGVAIYPNPTADQATLSFLPSPAALLVLTDVTGRSVPFRRSGVMLYLDDIPPGLYILHIRDGERRYTTKLVKQ